MASSGNRQSELSIDLGGEQIQLKRIEASEALSEPFAIDVEIIATLGEFDLLPHLGKPAAMTVREDDEHSRYFHGLVVGGRSVRESTSGFHYRIQLAPWTYYLDQNNQFAIFQEKKANEIIKMVLDDAKITDYRFETTRKYRKRVYCVQYNESDFAFISRLMEEEGIYYYFEHEESKHVMVLCDAPRCHKKGGVPRLTWRPAATNIAQSGSGKRHGAEKIVQDWTENVASSGRGKVVFRDYDFERPQQPIEAALNAKGHHSGDEREYFVYPGRYVSESDGARLGQTALERLRAMRRVFSGASDTEGLECGRVVGVSDHPTDRFNRDYIVIRTFHSITGETYRSGDLTQEDPFNVQIEAIPDDDVFRPPVRTPRPVVKGLETAKVTGPPGETIYTDKYGRVKVRFPWDRATNEDEKSSCWVRVSQTGGLGNIILPRVGHEVLVDFLNGDPDQPLVVGRMFNAEHMPTYPLPANKTRALWRTFSYKEQGQYPDSMEIAAQRSNEIRFEDMGGKEEIYIHAERDMLRQVRFKDELKVGNDQTITIGHDRTETVKNDETVTIEGKQTLKVIKDRTRTVEGAEKITVQKTGTELFYQDLKIESYTKIELVVGASKITIGPAEIKLNAPTITIDAVAKLDAKSVTTTVQGIGMLNLTGAITKINC